MKARTVFSTSEGTRSVASAIGRVALVATSICVATAPSQSRADMPDYFVEWVQPSSANLYVDTGVRGKTGVKAELQFLFSRPSDQRYPVMLGSWGSKRFNLVMNDYDESRWEYGESMSNLGGLAYEGALCTADVEVSAAGLMSGTWTDSQGKKITPTKDAVAQQGVIDTGLNLYLFASNQNGSPSQGGKSRLYYCKLWQGDTGSWTLVRNLRPCVKNGVAGLYDYVTGNILYPVSSAAGCVFVAGPVAYDRIATWNGGATPTAAELATASNWSCTDTNGVAVASAVPDKATLVVFPAGIGSVTLPASYAAPWGAVRAEGSVAHPATQYGTCANGRVNVVVPAYGYTVRGEGNFSDLINARSDNSARKLDFGGKQMRHDGWFYVNAAQAGTWAMTLYVDDYYAFYIDDVQVLSYHDWRGGVAGAATCEVSEGWHRFTSIIGDTGGGWGTATTFGNNKVPFTFVVNGTTYSLTDDVTFPKGIGTSTITLSADADWSALGKVALQGGARIDLNGHSLVVDDILADDYLGTEIMNSSANASTIFFKADPYSSVAYTHSLIKGVGSKIFLQLAGAKTATWTGVGNDGSPANAANWQVKMGDVVLSDAVPDENTVVSIEGQNVNLQVPVGTSLVCTSFQIGNCTFTADCDWRGLSVRPTITGTANLNGHVLKLNGLSAAADSSFSGGYGSFVEFVVDESATIANLYEYTYIKNPGNLALSGNAKGYLNLNGGTLTVSRGDGFNVGRDGHGTLVQNGGTLTANEGGTGAGINNVWRIAWGVGYTGSYTLNDGTAIAKSNFNIGDGGTATYVQNGGTIIATNVTDGVNFITGLNNVTYGPGGLTLDTAGYDVTMATASGAAAVAGSSFVKAGTGILTMAALPPTDAVVVNNGTLALSGSYDNASMLAHRWSFTSDLTDSVTGAAGTMSGSGATYEDGVVKLPGGNKGTCYIDLGANKLPSDSVTIETWFTLRSQVDWTRVFVIGGSSGHYTVFNSRRGTDGNACNFDSLGGTQIVTGSGKVLAKDEQYYAAVIYTPDGNGNVVEKQYVKKVGDSGFIWNNTVTKANWSVTANAAQGYFWLGHSNGNDKDTNIDYDEVRVWNGALDDTAIALSAQKGPDATADDIAEIAAATRAALPMMRTMEIASGATLSLGAGNTLEQPVVSGGGMVIGGTLKVTKELRAKLGDCLTIGSGATFDIDGAKVTFSAEDIASLATTRRTYTLVKAANGGTITGNLLQPDTDAALPKGWHVTQTPGFVKLRKNGVSIHFR